MLEKITDLPPGIDGVNAVGTVTKQDYEAAFTPLVDAARRENRHIRLLYQLGPGFHKITVDGAWVDAVIGIRDWRLFEGFAASPMFGGSAWTFGAGRSSRRVRWQYLEPTSATRPWSG